MNISIQITGAQDVELKLQRLGKRLFMLDKSMRQIGEYLAHYYANEAFASQGQVFSKTWPRLSQKYSVWKAKNFPGRPPLVLRGDMQKGFNFLAGSSSVKVGNSTPEFIFQQMGTSRGIPARPMAGISEANKRMISNIVNNEIQEMLASV